MSSTFGDKYSVTNYSVNSILGFIEIEEIAIPEIQRPFVWKATNVRDLIDSLYNGYPTGYLIIWQNPSIRDKNGKLTDGKKILIDGQQRVTALMTAIAGREILTNDYKNKTIKIAFNPLAEGEEERFAVQTPAHIKSRHWISDISDVFKPGFDSFSFVNNYVAENPGIDATLINKEITRLIGIRNCQLGAILLVPQLDISEVTEIFVRVNSQGKQLNESDFAMSKIAADNMYGGNMLRKAIDYFCHLAASPSFYEQLTSGDKEFTKSKYMSKIAWLKDDKEDIYDPDYSDMLRVSFMHVFGRGKLGDLVSLLSGRDFADRTYKAEIAKESFLKLDKGILNFINEYHFKQFILAITSAGFKYSKLLNSKITLDFAYTLYLLLHADKAVNKSLIKKYVQKWFVMSTLTGRYTASPESQMDRDLRSIGSKGFVPFFEEVEESMLSDTFWNTRLVQNLETTSFNSPACNTYTAAQIFAGDFSFLTNSFRVSDLLASGDVHHIFPRAYLKKNGIDDRNVYNQVANYIYLDTPLNIQIDDKAPEDYLRKALEQCTTKTSVIGTITELSEYYYNLDQNCIPHNVAGLTAQDYPAFLSERRRLMAEKIRKYYYSL